MIHLVVSANQVLEGLRQIYVRFMYVVSFMLIYIRFMTAYVGRCQLRAVSRQICVRLSGSRTSHESFPYER